MKKSTAIIISIVCAVIAMAIFTASIIATNQYNVNRLYPKTAVVDRVENEYTIICIDYCKNVWIFYDETGDWQKDDVVSLLINNKGTATIYDDEIVTARYNGVTKNWK